MTRDMVHGIYQKEVYHADRQNICERTKPGSQVAQGLPAARQRVFINKIGNIVILIPKDDPWSSLLNSLNQFTDDFVENRNQPNQDSREALNDIHQSSSES